MLLGVMATLAIPKWVDDFALIQITIYVVMAILAISQAFIWGFSGILCSWMSRRISLAVFGRNGSSKNPIVEQISEHVYCGVRLGGMGVAIGSLIGTELADLV